MDVSAYAQFMIALAIVLALIAGCAWAARRAGLGGAIGHRRGQARRISVVEAVAVDGKRRLVLVRCDRTEHLVLIGGATDLVIERGLPASAASAAAESETAEPAR